MSLSQSEKVRVARELFSRHYSGTEESSDFLLWNSLDKLLMRCSEPGEADRVLKIFERHAEQFKWLLNKLR